MVRQAYGFRIALAIATIFVIHDDITGLQNIDLDDNWSM